MDILEFAQCLSYIELTKQQKSSLEMLLPYGGALTGVVVGFLINIARDKIKDNVTNKKKILCIDEEVHRLRRLCESCASESMDVVLTVHKGEVPSSARLPSNYETPLLKEFFPNVALKYSVNDRYYLKELLSNTKKLETLTDRLLNAKPGKPMCIAALESLEASAYCIGICDLFYREPSRGEIPALLKSLGYGEGEISIYRKTTR